MIKGNKKCQLCGTEIIAGYWCAKCAYEMLEDYLKSCHENKKKIVRVKVRDLLAKETTLLILKYIEHVKCLIIWGRGHFISRAIDVTECLKRELHNEPMIKSHTNVMVNDEGKDINISEITIEFKIK